MRAAVLVLTLLAALAPNGCVRSVATQGPVALAVDEERDGQAMYVQWLGVSSWVISRGHDVVVVDPFFSRPRFRAMLASWLFGGLAGRFGYDAERIGAVLPDLPRDTRFVLVGHAHYDHLMDVAYYIKRKSGEGVRYVGSATARNILMGFDPAGLDFWVAGEGRRTQKGRVRVTAFPGDHAPHFLGLRFMTGEIPEPMTSPPTRVGQYPEGRPQVYFIDFLDEAGRVARRVFVNSAASRPEGAEALRRHPEIVKGAVTNVAILCVPGWDKVEEYPNSVLSLIDPEHVVLSHYDDFWSPYRNGEDPRAGMKFVAFANYEGFLDRLERLREQHDYRYEIHQPKTGQCLRFPARAGALRCER